VELAIAIERLRESNETLRQHLEATNDRAPSTRSAAQLHSALSAGNQGVEAIDPSRLALSLRQDAVLLQAHLYAIAGALDSGCAVSAGSAAEPAPREGFRGRRGRPPRSLRRASVLEWNRRRRGCGHPFRHPETEASGRRGPTGVPFRAQRSSRKKTWLHCGRVAPCRRKALWESRLSKRWKTPRKQPQS
jgi:hypothetical protein